MTVAKILVVEDEGLRVMELQRKLKFWGYKVPTFAFSRKEAVKKAEKLKPDLILMDIVLKGEGDGIDAVREIKNSFDIPIIYLTAYSDENTIKRAEITEPKHIEVQEYFTEMKNILENKIEGKNSALERVNKDLNTQIAKRIQVENQFHEKYEKLKKEVGNREAEFEMSAEKMEAEIGDLKLKTDEATESSHEKEKLLKDVQSRFKRNMQRISSLTSLQSDYIGDQIMRS